ncbi:MAG: L,D-transpeptidase family protein [Myxococcota bacterium]
MGRAALGTAVWMLALAACAPALPPPPAPAPPPAEPPPQPAPPAPPPGRESCQRVVRIEVYKAERRLVARCEGGAVVEMVAAMGRDPDGHKRAVGDLRTPEGLYRVSGPPLPSRFHAFLPIDYPSVADADRALADGRISPGDHARIVDAHRRGVEPPDDTPLGGGIGLHGEGERWAGDSRDLDWTLGCIAVPDDDLDFLLARTGTGTPFEILP